MKTSCLKKVLKTTCSGHQQNGNCLIDFHLEVLAQHWVFPQRVQHVGHSIPCLWQVLTIIIPKPATPFHPFNGQTDAKLGHAIWCSSTLDANVQYLLCIVSVSRRLGSGLPSPRLGGLHRLVGEMELTTLAFPVVRFRTWWCCVVQRPEAHRNSTRDAGHVHGNEACPHGQTHVEVSEMVGKDLCLNAGTWV